MALIVEDGSIVQGAESLCSVADADAYHAAIGNADWALLTEAGKEQSLRKSTQYMQGQYGGKWAGYRKDSSQSLDWPRSYVLISDTLYVEYLSDSIVPLEVKNACASLAFRASSVDLLADEEKDIVSETVDVITTVYSQHSPQRKRYPEVDQMLTRYLAGNGGLKMVRV